jgi:anti-sigma B factor antagonist
MERYWLIQVTMPRMRPLGRRGSFRQTPEINYVPRGQERSMPAGSSRRIAVAHVGDVAVVTFADDKLLEEVTIAEVGDALDEMIDENNRRKILLNFTKIRKLSSAALGMLSAVNRTMQKKGGQLRLCGIQNEVEEVFRITRMVRLFQIDKNELSSLEAFK